MESGANAPPTTQLFVLLRFTQAVDFRAPSLPKLQRTRRKAKWLPVLRFIFAPSLSFPLRFTFAPPGSWGGENGGWRE
jgi:hypothetical protein